MKRLILICLLLGFSNFPLFADDCYFVVENPGNYNPENLINHSIPLISKYFETVKTPPPFGVRNTDCQYIISISEDREKMTVSINGKKLRGTGDSTLIGMNGFEQALLRTMAKQSSEIQVQICKSYGAKIPKICGIDISASPSEEEKEFWEIVKDSKEKDDFYDFLNEFPNGKYRYVANIFLIRLREKPVEVDKEKNGSALQEKEVWKLIKETRHEDELQYFINEFPKGRYVRAVKVLLRRTMAGKKKEAERMSRFTTKLSVPRSDGFYIGKSLRSECFWFERYYEDGTMMTWSHDNLEP